jgi:hypothetical protein
MLAGIQELYKSNVNWIFEKSGLMKTSLLCTPFFVTAKANELAPIKLLVRAVGQCTEVRPNDQHMVTYQLP